MKKIVLALLFLLGTCATNLISQNLDSRAGDEQALVDLYNSTDGSNWHDNTGWNGTSMSLNNDIVGITAEVIGGELRVTRIDMQKIYRAPGEETASDGNNLTGTLPESIGNLTKVEYFNVKQNNLTGHIPESIGNMASLRWLSLGGQRCDLDISNRSEWYEARHRGCERGSKRREHTNAFTGSIPSSLSNLSNLEILEIRAQRIQGNLPKELGNCKNLKAIFLNDNLLTGELPAEWGAITGIVFIHLDNTGLDMNVPVGEFTGSVPDEWQINWNNLANIRLQSNNLSGPAPEFPNSRDKRYVKVNDNNFSGNFPISYFNGDNANMSMFGFNNNNLSGTLPETIPSPNFPVVRNQYFTGSFHITNNNFDGPLPDWVQELTNNTQFQIAGNNFSGTFPSIAAENSNLRLFWVYGNNFSGHLPDINWSSDNILSILFGGNNFEGPISESWESLYKNHIDQNGNYSGRIWRFEGGNNNLRGELPKWLAELPTLARIKLDNNKFTFKDILPHYDAILANVQQAARNRGSDPVFDIAPQKPFGNAFVRTMPIGENLILDLSNYDYEGNQYQWFKNGLPIEGANSPILSVSNIQISDEGDYYLEVSNPALPELGTHRSETITLRTGEDDDLNEGEGDSGNGDENSNDEENVLNAPDLISPERNANDVSLYVSFEWSSVDADEYILHISRRNEEGNHEEFFYSDNTDVRITDTTYTLSIETFPETVHGWRVRGVKDGELGPWSDNSSFISTKGDGGSSEEDTGNNGNGKGKGPNKSTPENNEEKVSKKPKFKWESVEDAESYTIQVSSTESSTVIIEEVIYDTLYTPEQDLMANSGYEWRVRANQNGAEGEWSDTWYFTTGEEFSDEFSVDEPSLNQNYPNPFNPSTQIRFTIPESQDVTLRVYDMAGRLVATLFDGSTLSAGTHQMTFSAQGLASGVYFYRLITESEIITRKMTLMK